MITGCAGIAGCWIAWLMVPQSLMVLPHDATSQAESESYNDSHPGLLGVYLVER